MTAVTIKNTLLMVGSLLIGGVIAVGGYHYLVVAPAASAQAEPRAPEPKVLFWYDPMYPNTKFDQPGKSPFMDMDLVAKYADGEGQGSTDQPGIRIDATQTQNLGLKTEKVRRGKLDYALRLPASLSFNEYQYHIVQARGDGFIEKVYPLTLGDNVTKGTPLVEVTIPAWVEAQSEYLLLANTGADKAQTLGVLERLRLAGMPENDILALKKNHKVQTRFQIRAPIDGVITAFDLKTGMNISKDNVIAQIQGVDPIWINASLPESVAYLLTDESQFQISLPAYPNISINAEQWTLLPSVDTTTRTLQVRVQVENRAGTLKPGMNAYLTLHAQSPEMLLIPSQAVIDSGDEQRVITLDDNGRFVPKRITVFHESQQQTAISAGLAEHESVVTSGLFLIDSEANISGALERMRQSAPPEAATAVSASHIGH